jgi:hypothetical protein
MNLVYSSLNEQVRERFPVLEQPQYTELIGGIEAGPYIVFGVLFNRYLADLATGADLQAKSGVASFIEDMAATKDDRVSDMLTTEVLPTLLGSQAMVDSYWPLLGMETRRRLRLVGPRLSGKVELPASE